MFLQECGPKTAEICLVLVATDIAEFEDAFTNRKNLTGPTWRGTPSGQGGCRERNAVFLEFRHSSRNYDELPTFLKTERMSLGLRPWNIVWLSWFYDAREMV